MPNPLPQTLPKECAKAAKIFRSFVDSGNNGLDGMIPREILQNAKGFAIFTIFKAGFVFSARAGSGVVIAKLDDGTWSAPSAIGTAGLGVGGQLGAEMTDFLVVLNSKSAVRSFMAAGSLTLGGNVSIAVGPLGRNGEAVGALNTSGKMAAMYSYSKTRGLFGGISIEGSVIVERQDANVQAYHNSDVTVKKLLGGTIEPPPWASVLIKTLEACTGIPGTRKWVEDAPIDTGYAFSGASSPAESPGPSQLRKKRKPSFPPESWGQRKDGGSYFSSETSLEDTTYNDSTERWDDGRGSKFDTHFRSDFTVQSQRHNRMSQSVSESADLLDFTSPVHTRSMSMGASNSMPTSSDWLTSTSFSGRDDGLATLMEKNMTLNNNSPSSYIKPRPELARPLPPHEGVARAIALYDFKAVEPGDLSLSKGDVIIITKKSESTDDWWTGKINDRKGIFPANFVELVK